MHLYATPLILQAYKQVRLAPPAVSVRECVSTLNDDHYLRPFNSVMIRSFVHLALCLRPCFDMISRSKPYYSGPLAGCNI